mgnify:CR=1 FL=1
MNEAEMQACFFCQEWIPARARHCPYCGESLTFPSRAEILDEKTDLDPILEGQVDDLVLAYLRGVDLAVDVVALPEMDAAPDPVAAVEAALAAPEVFRNCRRFIFFIAAPCFSF